MSTIILIISPEKVHFAMRPISDDNRMLHSFSEKLTGMPKDRTIDRLHTIPWIWRLRDDIVYPWQKGDIRGSVIESMFTFDLENDLLLFGKWEHLRQHLRLPLSLLRKRSICETDFMPANEPLLSFPTIDDVTNILPPPYWEPSSWPIPERNMALVPRILQDFAYQWRHIFRRNYNVCSFRRLAYALIRIATIDFDVFVHSSMRIVTRGFIVKITDVPEWDYPKTDILSIGHDTKIILAQDMETAVSMARKDAAGKTDNNDNTAYYLLLSVRYIVFCRVCKDGTLEYTKPEPFINGIDPPSDAAIRLLLLATLPQSQHHSRLHHLPIELQDMILDRVSPGCLENARIGCTLGLGTPFLWTYGNRKLALAWSRRNKLATSSPDQEIWFGDHLCGIMYT